MELSSRNGISACAPLTGMPRTWRSSVPSQLSRPGQPAALGAHLLQRLRRERQRHRRRGFRRLHSRHQAALAFQLLQLPHADPDQQGERRHRDRRRPEQAAANSAAPSPPEAWRSRRCTSAALSSRMSRIASGSVIAGHSTACTQAGGATRNSTQKASPTTTVASTAITSSAGASPAAWAARSTPAGRAVIAHGEQAGEYFPRRSAGSVRPARCAARTAPAGRSGCWRGEGESSRHPLGEGHATGLSGPYDGRKATALPHRHEDKARRTNCGA